MEEQESLITSETNVKVYPDKPTEESAAKSLLPSLASALLFIGASYLVFDWDLTYILVLAGVLLFHELGHFAAMKFYNYKDVSMFFVPFFGAFVSGTKDQISQKQSAVILLAGPLPGVLLGAVLYYFSLANNNDFLLNTANSMIFINLFNLLPIIPLDGGRLIKCLFFERSELIGSIFSYLSIGALFYYSITSQSYFLMLVPGFLMFQLFAQSQLKKTKKAVLDKGININKSFDELSNEEYWLVRDEIGKNIQAFSKYMTPGKYEISENEQKLIGQVKAVIQKEPIQDLKVGGKILFTAIWILSFIIPFVIIGVSMILTRRF
ncbi:site-2 protease family protein [Sporocytophaga myxococcoides]|uniref:site-2 protease family protein n=1 Tax=Sporocytophaga myxococcoides TaxID=153721 RepID=UPI0004190674|nr:site-2 protease family protein [Sporocytophaga myxococcoides]